MAKSTRGIICFIGCLLFVFLLYWINCEQKMIKATGGIKGHYQTLGGR